MHTKTDVKLHAKFLLFLFVFKQNRNMSTDIVGFRISGDNTWGSGKTGREIEKGMAM
jgi:hypothetical protein